MVLQIDPFAIPAEVGKFPNVDDDIQQGALVMAQKKQETLVMDRALYDAANDGAKGFVFDNVEEEWYLELKDPHTEYDKVTTWDIFEHLQKNCVDTVNALDIPVQMRSLYKTAPHMHNYINLLEEAQTRSKRTKLPVNDLTLMTIAVESVKLSGEFEKAMDAWDELSDPEQTWATFKTHFKKAWSVQDRKNRISKEGGNPFAGAAPGVAPQVHPPAPAPTEAPHAPTMDAIVGCFDNLALTMTNDKTDSESLAKNFAGISNTMDSLAGTLDRVTKENAQLREENASLRKKLGLKQAAPPSNSWRPYPKQDNVDAGGNQGNGKHPKNWKRGAYCWTHGHGTGHTSAECNSCKFNPNHKAEATRANTMGGNPANKGWDS